MTDVSQPKLKFAKRGRPSKEAKAAALAEHQAKQGPVLNDKELLDAIKERFDLLRELVKAAARGEVISIVCPGAPGIGKSWNVMSVLDAIEAKYERITGTCTRIELFKAAYKHRAPGQILLLDDVDRIFQEEDAMNVLKALTDSTKRRVVSWRTDAISDEDGVESTFEFKGSAADRRSVLCNERLRIAALPQLNCKCLA